MRRLCLIAVVAAGAWALPAAAQNATNDTVSSDVVFEGQVPRACLMATANAVRELNATLRESEGGRVSIELISGAFIDTSTGAPRATEMSLNLPVTCNAPHRIRISSTNGSLLREGGAAQSSELRSRIDFRVDLEFAGQTGSFDTVSGNGVQIAIAEAATGTARVTITIPAGGAPLVAGAYSDTLIIEVQTNS